MTMAVPRRPFIAVERFLHPVFDEDTGALRTTRLVEPSDRAELTETEAAALGGKARATEPATPEPPPEPQGMADGGA